MKTIKKIAMTAGTLCMSITTVFVSMILGAVPAYATDAITSGVNQGTQKIWNILTSIVGPIGAVALAVCAVKMIWGNARSADEAKGTLVRIIVAIAIVFLAPSIIKMISGWFSGSWSF